MAGILGLLNLELPQFETIDEYIDFIIPKIYYLGEDLDEMENYTNKPWLQITDNYDDNDVVLHIFKPKIEPNDRGSDTAYLRSVNGNLSQGSWNYLPDTNQLMINHGGRYELYNLAFLNENFFILVKHGNVYESTQAHNGQKYFFMVREKLAKKRLDVFKWQHDSNFKTYYLQPIEMIEELYNVRRFNAFYMGAIFMIVFLVFFIFVFSFL